MSKTDNKIKTSLAKYGNDVGIAVMTLATVVGMLELPDHSANRYVLPSQLVKVEENNLNDLNNPIRREKEETASQYISYNETQRTPSRSGRL